MRRALRPEDVVVAVELADEALRPFVAADWSVGTATLDWSVEHTIVHMIAAPAKYTLYLASRSPSFIALTMAAWPDVTHEELIDSIVPVANGLVAVAATTPREVRAFHADGPTSADGFVAKACVELLVHCHDALSGLGGELSPPAELATAVLHAAFPGLTAGGSPWQALVGATGRPSP